MALINPNANPAGLGTGGLGQGLLALQGMGGTSPWANTFPQGLNSTNSPRPGGLPTSAPGGLPSPSTAPTGGSPQSPFGGTSPWAQSVTASLNGNPTSFASPGSPNTNYVTPDAASTLGRLFGANVVSQNLNNMASPGSSAPSAPMYGLDFGRGDVQDAGMGAFQLQRGDSQDLVGQRYQAGLNNSGWGGPAPQMSSNADIFWNRDTPVSTNAPTPQQSAAFAPRPDAGAAQFAANTRAAGTSPSGGSQGGQPDQAQLFQMLMRLFGIQG